MGSRMLLIHLFVTSLITVTGALIIIGSFLATLLAL